VLEQGALASNLLGMSFLGRLSRFEVQRGTLVLER
jgi:predicted aspartyl protease